MKSQKELQKESKPFAKELERKMKEARPKFSIPISLLRMGAKDARLRSKLLEFVDVLPQLHSSRDMQEHFEMYLGPLRRLFPFPLRLGSYAMRVPIAYKLAAALTRWLIDNQLAPYFIVRDEREMEKITIAYEKEEIGVIADFLGELVVSDEEAEYFFNKYKNAVAQVGGPSHIAIKFSSLYPFFGPENYEESKRRVAERFEDILRRAQEYDAFVTVDAEHYIYRRLVEDIFTSTILKPEFRNTTRVGIAVQTYLKDSFFSADNLLDVAKYRGVPFVIRLVKGAYWDTEVALADQNGWESPVRNEKWKTDESFDTLLYYLMKNWKYLYVSPATHNAETIAFAYYAAREFGVLDDSYFAFQVLYGLGESVRKVLCQEKLPVLVYTPVGDLETGMAYFARRILENTANDGFLFRLIRGR